MSITDLSVQVCQYMVGQKKAVQVGNTLYLSPAMWDLMEHADDDELKHLLAHIDVMKISEERP